MILNYFQFLRANYKKALTFALYGAIGCLIASLILGEWFLNLTQLSPIVENDEQAVILLIDSSGSMAGGKLEEVKAAALGFVERRDFSQEKIGVVNFGYTVDLVSPLTSNFEQLKQGISSLEATGGTPMGSGLQTAITALSSVSSNRHILLFTDGIPNSQIQAISAAQRARNLAINIIAVATGDADINYLSRITDNPELVFYTNSGEIDLGFRNAESVIYNKQLLESQATANYSLLYSSLRTGGWTAILAFGLSLPLIMAQNRYLRRRLLTSKEFLFLVIGSGVAGLIAGGTGSLLFTTLTTIPNSELITGVINWGIAGTISFGVLSLFRRDIPRQKLLIGGLIIGVIASLGWIFTLYFLGDLGVLISGLIVGIGAYYLSKSQGISWFLGIVTLFVGQWLLFPPVSFSSTLEIAGRLMGWTILGAIVGLGLSFFIPNLQRTRALLGGSIGGSLGSIGFLITSFLLVQVMVIQTNIADPFGRLIGAFILGFCIGLMIFWEEERQFQSNTHLLIHWNAKETSKLLLGEQPIWLGSSSDAQIPLSKTQYAPLTAKIFKQGNQVIMQFHPNYAEQKGMKKTKQELFAGNRRTFGEISFEIVDEI